MKFILSLFVLLYCCFLTVVISAQAERGTVEIFLEVNSPIPKTFNFTTTGGLNPLAFSLTDGSSTANPKRLFFINSTTRRNYTITQELMPSYRLSDIVCVQETFEGGVPPVITRFDRRISIDTDFCCSVTCTFKNDVVTAASVTVSGRVVSYNGRGISRALVTMTGANGETQTVSTNPFGYYRFADVQAGATYIFSVSSKRYRFNQPTQVQNIAEDTDDINFIADN